MGAIVQFSLYGSSNYSSTRLTTVSIDEYAKNSGHTFIGQDTGSIEKRENGVLFDCITETFGLTRADLKNLFKHRVVQQEIGSRVRVFHITDDQLVIQDKVLNPKLQILREKQTKHPFLLVRQYTITLQK